MESLGWGLGVLSRYSMPLWASLAVLLGWTTALTDGLSVWVAPSLERIGQDSPATSETTAVLRAARGEYESFQIAIKAPASGALTNAGVTVSDLGGPDGHVIPNTDIALFREQYVRVSTGSPNWGGSNQPLGPGWYPDALIPFVDPETGAAPAAAPIAAVPFAVSPGRNQVIWVDVFVPRDAVSGQYQGVFRVTSDQAAFTGNISLEVWNFTLPLKPSLKSSFLIWSAPTLAAARELLRNKVSPSKAPFCQRELIDRYGLVAVDLGFWSGADISHCTMRPAPPVEDLRKAAESATPGLFLYNYTADEIDRCPSLVAPLKQWARNLHSAGIRSLVTMAPTSELLDDGSGTGQSAVDIWAMLPVVYDGKAVSVAQARGKGDELWSYNALVQDAYSPKWQVDFAPINFRIQPGFISQSLGLRGLLYWRVDLWSQSPWTEANSPQFSIYPGEGMLVYPGSAVGLRGVAPSTRLKWIRDGVEDYEYVELLKKTDRAAWAKETAAAAGADWRRWTRNPADLESTRRQLGEALDQIAPDGAATGAPLLRRSAANDGVLRVITSTACSTENISP